MSSSINVNITALTTQRYLATSQSALAISMQRLSSGLRINSAKDDAAGLAIGSNMTTLIRCQTVAMRNANDEISLSQTKEGALGKMGDLLQRMRELAVQAPNATNSDNDRAYLNTEFVQMQDELQRIRKGTSFNGTKVFADNALDPTLPNCTLTGTKTTVSAGVNDTLQVTLNGVSANVTLAAGSYTQTALASALQSAINSKSTFVSAGSSVSASIVNGALSLVSTRQGAGSGVSLAGATASELFGATAASSSGQPLAGTIDGGAAVVSGSTLTGAPATTAAGLTVTALAGTTTGSYTLNVGQLATSGSWVGLALPGSTSITAGVNDNLQVTLDGQSASVTLAAGSYTQAALASAVQTAINSNSTFLSAGSSVSASITVDGALSLVSASKGAGSGISLAGTAASTLINGVALAATPTTTIGTDLMGTINGVAAVVSDPPPNGGQAGLTLNGVSGTAAEGWTFTVENGTDPMVGSYAIHVSQVATQPIWLGGVLPPSITITAGVNDRMYLTGYNRTIAAGTYTPVELAAAVQTALNNPPAGCPALSASIVNGALSLVKQAYGQAEYVQIQGSAYYTLSAGVSVPIPHGQNAVGTINGAATSSWGRELWGGGNGTTVSVLAPTVGDFTINISQKATTGSWIGNPFAPGTTFNVTTGVNDTLEVTYNGVSTTVTLAAGNYTSENSYATDSILWALYSAIPNSGPSFNENNALRLGTNYGANSINLTGGTALSMLSGVATATTSSGQNASGQINGVAAVASGQTFSLATGLTANVSNGTGSHTINVSQLATQGSWLAAGLPGSANILDQIDAALQQVNTEMVVQGATQNQLTSVVANLQTSNENLMEARSRIMDTDYAAETANLARSQILQQVGIAMLAQANQSPKDVLALLR